MAKKRENRSALKIDRPKRVKLSAKESLKRMLELEQRKGKFIAAVREAKNRGLSA